MDTEQLIKHLAALEEDAPAARAPARLKSRIYSALVHRMSEGRPLLSLAATKETGTKLCIFEDAVAALPVGERIGSKNLCRVCHARVLGERLDWAPIFWPGCPYSQFHNE